MIRPSDENKFYVPCGLALLISLNYQTCLRFILVLSLNFSLFKGLRLNSNIRLAQ